MNLYFGQCTENDTELLELSLLVMFHSFGDGI